MKKGFNRIFYYGFIAVLSSILHLNLSAAPNIVDDFSGSLSLDKYTDVENSRILDTVNQNLILSSKGSAFFESFKSNNIAITDGDISLFQADLSVSEVSLGNSESQQTFVRLGGLYYRTAAAAEARVFTTISLGDRGNGLEAWYEIQESIPGSVFDIISYKQGKLNTSALSLNTPYTSSITYDNDNNFTFTFNNETPITVSGPEKASPLGFTFLLVGTSLRFGLDNTTPNNLGDSRLGDGSVAFVTSTVDNVVTSTTSPLAFDDFSADQIDFTKWNNDEASTEIVNEQLVMKVKTQTTVRGSRGLRLQKSDVDFISVKASILNSSVWNPGTRIRGRLQYYIGNDTFNVNVGDNFNGFEGDIYSHISLERNTDGRFRIQIYAGRATDFDFNSETDLFFPSFFPLTPEFPLPISYGDIFELAIEKVEGLINYKVNGVTLFTFDPYDTTAYPALSGNVYPASDRAENGIQARVQNGPGEAHIQFDDLTISDETNRNAVKRAEVALSLLRAKYGKTYTPPAASGTLYNDVSATDFNVDWIEQLAIDGITEGCDANKFCPNMVVTKEQLAQLILKAKYGDTYVPAATTGDVFTDISTSDVADWIEELAKQGLSAGCEKDKFCPKEAVTLTGFEDMLVRAFPKVGSLTAIPPDLPLSNSDVERQVFFNQSGNIAATYLENGAGIVYSNGDGSVPGSDPYSWLISNNVLTISQAGEADFTYTAKNIEGNKYTFYNSDLQRTEIYFRGLPFSISDLQGKIYSIDVSNEPDCTSATIKFNINTADYKEVCNGVQEVFTHVYVSVSSLDNVVGLQTETLDPVTFEPIVSSTQLVLLKGSTESTMKVAIISDEDGALDELEIDTWTLTDEEAF